MNRYRVDGYYWRDGSTSDWSHVVSAHTAADALTEIEVRMGIRDGKGAGAFNRIREIRSLPEDEL